MRCDNRELIHKSKGHRNWKLQEPKKNNLAQLQSHGQGKLNHLSHLPSRPTLSLPILFRDPNKSVLFYLCNIY